MTDRSTSLELAATAGLRYVSDEAPGSRRVRRGKGFSYVDAAGESLPEAEREWIRSLAIPPAWTDVWICPHRDGHILATGYDEAGRKQYIYHPAWEEARDEAKFERLGDFGSRLASLRRRIDSDLRRPGLERDKVVALAVAVLDRTLIRVGNRQYAESNDSYGLTTLTREHVELNGSRVSLAFVGKGGAEHELAFSDRRLASLLTKCQELGGQTLFGFESEAGVGTIGSGDVNDYLADATGRPFTAKDFRTWGATSIVVGHLATCNGVETPQTHFLEAVDVAADRLGNTRQVCRASYVHPVIEAATEDGRIAEAWRRSRSGKWLTRPESAVRRLLNVS
ncbi:MAG TPA: DNA topoisomerase IB [Acidimicrobiia bacterium]|nr:DNA topoisomerase IB [Acidimicrobiia bacterium]